MGQGSEGKRIAQQELSGFSRRPRGWSQGVRAGNRELQTLRCHHRPLTGHQPHPHSFVFQKLFRSPGTVSGHTVDTTQVLAPSFWPQVARAIGGIARQLGRQWGGGGIAFIMETAARSASPSKSPGNTPLRVRVAPLLLSALEVVVQRGVLTAFCSQSNPSDGDVQSCGGPEPDDAVSGPVVCVCGGARGARQSWPRGRGGEARRWEEREAFGRRVDYCE